MVGQEHQDKETTVELLLFPLRDILDLVAVVPVQLDKMQ
jgi:hypothetical protein